MCDTYWQAPLTVVSVQEAITGGTRHIAGCHAGQPVTVGVPEVTDVNCQAGQRKTLDMGSAATGSALPAPSAEMRALTASLRKSCGKRFRAFSIHPGWAIADHAVKPAGPDPLLRRVLHASGLTALAEELCLQEWLDEPDPAELAAVCRDTTLPGTAR